MDSNGHYLLNLNPPALWSRSLTPRVLLTPDQQVKKKFEVLTQNRGDTGAVTTFGKKSTVDLTTSVRIGNVVYPVQADLYAAVLNYLKLNPPTTLASLKTAISTAQQQLSIPPRFEVLMSRIPKVLNTHPIPTYRSGGIILSQNLVPVDYPINFRLTVVNVNSFITVIRNYLKGLLARFEAVFINQSPILLYSISFIADDGTTYLSSLSDLYKNKSGRQIISNADWYKYSTQNIETYSDSLVIIKPINLDIYGGIYAARMGFILSDNTIGENANLYLVIVQGPFETYKVPYTDTIDVGFQFVSADWVAKKDEINLFLENYNFHNNVNFKLLEGQNVFPQLA
jgi:hypothetical protein